MSAVDQLNDAVVAYVAALSEPDFTALVAQARPPAEDPTPADATDPISLAARIRR